MYKKSNTIVATAIAEVPGFESLCLKPGKSFSINGKAQVPSATTAMHGAPGSALQPETLSTEMINDDLFHCQNLHKTPSESFFKHTIFGLRAIYNILGMKG